MNKSIAIAMVGVFTLVGLFLIPAQDMRNSTSETKISAFKKITLSQTHTCE